ncbi:hypothetical protein B0T16DRAFT_512591 [Cercophora newfieldiana]|uniref:BHLH domain-containing protein n=1 Tax=Cercophora newfieldiana TaxID=92897 RepID=A0AA39XZW8_9PEZI|nr:hypothetical protein B0T16DRAFT_512591 [Cercophora newfieldiana]
MHPVPTSRLAYSLTARWESSFPERHGWSEPDDMSHLENHHHDEMAYSQPGFPKVDIFAPGLSSFWQQNWLDQSQPLLHHSRHPHHDRITSPHQAHHAPHHEFFTPSPISPIHQPSETSSAQTEWDILRATTTTTAADGHTHAPLRQATPPPSPGCPRNNNNPLPHYPFPPLPSAESKSKTTPTPTGPSTTASTISNSPRSSSRTSNAYDAAAPPAQAASPSGMGMGMYQTFRVGNKRPPTTASAERVEIINLCGSSPIITTTGTGTAPEDLSPDDYAAKVQERRIAHKLSEKSRRNRLTAAIREIHKLMPSSSSEEQEKDGTSEMEREAMAQQMAAHFSKVDVVEMAVGFIRRLKRENERLAERVKAVEERERERERLREGEGTKEASPGAEETT